MAKMGRPTTNPKDRIIRIRATKDDREKLLYCCEKLNTTQYEVVTQGINMVYEKINKGVCFQTHNQANKLLTLK